MRELADVPRDDQSTGQGAAIPAPGSDPAGPASWGGGSAEPLTGWATAASRVARRAGAPRGGPYGRPGPDGPEGGTEERTERNARSSPHAPGGPPRGLAPRVPVGVTATEPTGAPAPGAAATTAPGPMAGPAKAAGGPADHTRLRARLEELDQRIARIDVLIGLIEADVERNRLLLGAVGAVGGYQPRRFPAPRVAGGPGSGSPLRPGGAEVPR